MSEQILTIEEVQSDLEDTKRDITRLTAIVENLHAFIFDSVHKNRALLRTDLFKYETFLLRARDLLPRIEAKLNSLKS